MQNDLQTAHTEYNLHGSVKGYIAGFILSIILTLSAYFVVANDLLQGWTRIHTLISLGIVQMVVQLIAFFHLNKERKPHFHILVFLFTALVVAILVLGSLWIMANLSEYVMSPMDMQTSSQ